jgi:hypothetical protein
MRIYWGLLLPPLVNISMGCLFLVIACINGWHWWSYVIFGAAVIIGIWMIRNNIAQGWGWHGQR